MFHPGKILSVYKEKNNTQASIEMWDENIFTFHVASNIANKIKKNDLVLVDYRPISEKVAIPKQLITKILNKKDDIWKTYKVYLKKKKVDAKARSKNVRMVPVQQPNSFAG